MMASRNSGFASKLTLAAGLLLAGAAMALYFTWGRGGESAVERFLPKTTIDEKATLSILRSEALSFLVTRRTSTQIVVDHSESNLLGEWQGVLWATVSWRWGVDLKKITEKDIRRDGDIIYCRLGEPELLDFGIEPGSEHFMSRSTAWPKMAEFFNTGSQQKVLHDRIAVAAGDFANKQGLWPSRSELVNQLNAAAAEIKKLAGMEIRFE